MAYVEMSEAERTHYEAKIAALPLHAEITVRFTSRGSRRARVCRVRQDGGRMIETYSPSREKWSAPRRLTADDLKLY